jgi:beta-glucuronidase
MAPTRHPPRRHATLRRTALLAGLALLLLHADARTAPAATDLAAPADPLAGQTPLIANVGARAGAALDGDWRAIVDPYETGYYNYRYEPSAEGYFRNEKPQRPSDRIEYDFDRSESLAVPGDWNSQRENLFLYEGTVWYKKSFRHPLAPGRRLFLHFGAANYLARVWVNGEPVGEHEGGFTPFDFEITDKLRTRDGSGDEDFVVVQVDNKRRRDGVPTLNTDWWNYGGLTRSVRLVEVPAVFIQDYVVQLARGSMDEIAGWVRLQGATTPQSVLLRIPEAGIEQRLTTDATGLATFRFPARLSLWSPENPELYEVEIAADGDSVRDEIGFRSIETRGTDILLNGKPIFLRGICLHEEAPYRGGRAVTRQEAETLLGWAKELGSNFVRLAHYPHGEEMTRAADRMGLLVWSEVPVYWTIAWENPATLANARRQLAEMIVRDRNRAAIILWSLANETPVSAPRNAFLGELARTARELDPTRLLTAALEHHYVDDTTVRIDDPLGQHLDVLGCNEYVGWYDGLPAKADSLVWTSAYDKPLVMSEFGACARAGLHGDAGERWTEEYQEDFFRHQVAMLERIPFLRGTAPWILMDFRSPRRHLPGVQDFWNRKGLVSDQGVKKKAFHVMRAWYAELARQHASAATAPAPAQAAAPR